MKTRTGKSVARALVLTPKDPNLSISFPEGTGVTKSASSATVPYSIGGTSVGTGTKAYVMVTDKAYTESGAAVLQYAALIAGSAAGTGAFMLGSNISGTWGSDYHVSLLAVNEGGEKKSDCASAPEKIEKLTVNATAEGYTGVYDAQPHGISVTVADSAR